MVAQHLGQPVGVHARVRVGGHLDRDRLLGEDAVESQYAWMDQHLLDELAGIARDEMEKPFDMNANRQMRAELALLTFASQQRIGVLNHGKFDIDGMSPTLAKRALKEGIDWRAKGVTTPIKSQGPHGVCGTFGQVQSAESQYAIGGGGSNPRKTPRPLTQFSEQQLLSCKPSSGGGEAYGGPGARGTGASCARAARALLGATWGAWPAADFEVAVGGGTGGGTPLPFWLKPLGQVASQGAYRFVLAVRALLRMF